jgi:hypothetical protein
MLIWHTKRSGTESFLLQRPAPKYFMFNSTNVCCAQALEIVKLVLPLPLSHVQSIGSGLIDRRQDLANRNHLSASDVGLAVDASIAGARADLLRLNIVVVSAGVLVADVLDAADVDFGESGSVAVVGVDPCNHILATKFTSSRPLPVNDEWTVTCTHQQEPCPQKQ